MKFNDSDIKKIVNQNSDYQIKKTSQDILNAYNATKTNQVVETPKKRFNWKVFTPIFASLATGACVLAVVLNLPKTDDPGKKPIQYDLSFIENNSKIIGQEMLIISSQANPISANSLNLLGISLFDNDDNEDENMIPDNVKTDIENEISKVDSFYKNNVSFSNIKGQVKEEENVISNNSYTHKVDYQYINNSFTYYFNGKDTDKGVSLLNGIYYETIIEEYKEVESDESETEINISLKALDGSSYIKINQEIEIENEGGSSEKESSFTYYYFNSLNDFNDDDYYLSYKLEVEEEEEIESTYEVIYNNKYSIKYEEILFNKNENILSLKYSYENNDDEFDGYLDIIYKDNSKEFHYK